MKPNTSVLIKFFNFTTVETLMAFLASEVKANLAHEPLSHSFSLCCDPIIARPQRTGYQTTKNWAPDYKELGTRLQRTGYQTTKNWVPDYKELGTRLQRTGHQTTKNWVPDYKELGTRLQRTGYQTTKNWAPDYKELGTRLQRTGISFLAIAESECFLN
nr:hypothetical protein BgiMline_030540 [Biomphalaria glabrata]